MNRQPVGTPTQPSSDGSIAVREPGDHHETSHRFVLTPEVIHVAPSVIDAPVEPAELPATSADRRWSDGDASDHLEELLVGQLPAFLESEDSGPAVDVELVGPHLRIAGTVGIGHFRRLSDFFNHHEGLIELRDATVLRRNGDPTKVTTRSIWISPLEVTLIGQPSVSPHDGGAPEFFVPKVPIKMIIVTPGHTMTGEVYIPADALLSIFIESSDPAFIPMTDVRTRSLADRRVISRYPFALLNRRHMVALTELQPGMAPGRTVL